MTKYNIKDSFKPTIGASIFALVAFSLLIGLGTWQVKRLSVKNALLNKINTRMSMPAVPMPDKLGNPDEWEFSRVTLVGNYLYDREFLIKPRTFEGKSGYHILVPFRRLSGKTVIINRGWISDELIPKISRPKGIIKLEGVIKLPQKTAFTPKNNIARNDWYWPDINAMAKTANLRNVAPVIVNIAERQAGVYPVGGRVIVNIVNNHKQYAIFWFVMAVILQVIFVFIPIKLNVT